MSEFYDIDKHREEAERVGQEAAEAFNEGWLENLKKADVHTVRAFMERYEAINYQREFGIITEEEYYQKLEEARDKYFSRNMQEWYKYTDEIYDYRTSKVDEYVKYVEEQQKLETENQRKTLEEQRKQYDEMCSEVQKNLEDVMRYGQNTFSDVQNQQQSYRDKLMDYAGSPTGFDTKVTWVGNYWPNGDPLKMVDYSLTDYEKEIEKLREFNGSIVKLKERAVDIDADVFSMFFDELKGMSIEDAKILTDLLLDANDEDFARHFELYKEKNDLAENMSLSYYGEDFSEIEKTLRTELAEVFDEIPEEFFEYGKLFGEEFFEGLQMQADDFLKSISIEVPVIEPSQSTTNVQNTEFSPVYYFYGDRATTSRTRLNSKNDALFNYFRGIY